MIANFIEMLSYDFIVRALIAGGILSICAALIGIYLVLRNQSMIGDGISHIAFGATAIAVAFGWTPTPIAIAAAIVSSLAILNVSAKRKIQNDAVIAVTSASALAIGTIAISAKSGVNIDLNSYLFGSLLSIQSSDLIYCTILAIVTISLFLACYRHIFAITFDENFAKAIGIKTARHNILLALLCSIVVVLGMKLLGTLLISSLIIFPCLTATQLSKSFKQTIIFSLITAIACFLIGLTTSYTYSLPSGASIVIVNLIALILAKIYAKLR